MKLHILTLSQIATLSVTNCDTRHKLRHFQLQIATPSQIATITNCYVTEGIQRPPTDSPNKGLEVWSLVILNFHISFSQLLILFVGSHSPPKNLKELLKSILLWPTIKQTDRQTDNPTHQQVTNIYIYMCVCYIHIMVQLFTQTTKLLSSLMPQDHMLQLFVKHFHIVCAV